MNSFPFTAVEIAGLLDLDLPKKHHSNGVSINYVCPVCGQQVQAKKESNVFCGECMKRMDYWELNNMELIEDYNGGFYEDSDWYKEMMDDMDC